jgi:hypothetical protein
MYNYKCFNEQQINQEVLIVNIIFEHGIFADRRAVGADCAAATGSCWYERQPRPGYLRFVEAGLWLKRNGLPVAGVARGLGQLAHDIHTVFSAGPPQACGPGSSCRATGRCAAHITGELDHRAGPAAHERTAQKTDRRLLGAAMAG